MFLRFKIDSVALKIQCPQGRAGSTPAAGIIWQKSPIGWGFFAIFLSFVENNGIF